MDLLKILHLCLITLEFLAGSAYVLYRLCQVIRKEWLRKAICGIIGFMSAFFIFVMILRTHNSGAWYLPLQAVEYTWVIFLFYLFILVVAFDFFRIAVHFLSKKRQKEMRWMPTTRRVYYALCLLFIPFLIAYGFVHFQHPEIRTVTFEVDKPVPDWKIVAVSDMHLGTMPVKTLQRNIQIINDLNPDLVLMLGDQFVLDWRDLEKTGYSDALGKLQASKGVFLINGNHEYYHGYPHNKNPEFKKMFRDLDFTILEDSVVCIENQLVIIGRDDTTNKKRASVETLMANIPSEVPVMVLDHNPNGMAGAERCGADIQLSGHTHNGQVFPLNLWGRLTYCIKGIMYSGYKKCGNTQYYVTSGLGSSGAPVRIGTDAEIVVVEMKAVSP